MYPTLNMSLLAQPTATAGADSDSLSLTESGEFDLAETFHASLARNLEPETPGGNLLPLAGTELPVDALDELADTDGELIELAGIDVPGLEIGLPGAMVPDSVEIDMTDTAKPAGLTTGNDDPARTLLPGLTAGPLTPADGNDTPDERTQGAGLQATAALRRSQTAEQASPRTVDLTDIDPDLPDRPLGATLEARPSVGISGRADDAAGIAARARAESPEIATERSTLAASMTETTTQRVGEQRPGGIPALAAFDTAPVLAPPTRPTINIGAPAQLQPLPSSVADVPIQTPVGEPGFDDAIADRVWVMTQARLSNAEIRLTPAELGPVRIQVAVDDGLANVSFQAAQAATREAIEQAMPRLRELLAENGLSLGQASVGDDGVRDGNRETTEQGPAGEFADDAGGDDTERELVASEASHTRRVSRSLVDTFA